MRKFLSAVLSAALAFCGISAMTANAEDMPERYKGYIGDATGDGLVDGVDASSAISMYASASVGDRNIEPDELSRTDVNRDGILDAKDASAILTYYAYSSTGHNVRASNYFISNCGTNDTAALLDLANDLYETACYACFDYETASRFRFNGDYTYKKDNITYFGLDRNIIKSMDDVYSDYYSIFGNDDFFLENRYIEGPDGFVYAPSLGRGSDIFYQYSTVNKIKSATADEIVFNVTSHYDGSYIGEDYVNDKDDEFVIRRGSDGIFRVTTLRLPY